MGFFVTIWSFPGIIVTEKSYQLCHKHCSSGWHTHNCIKWHGLVVPYHSSFKGGGSGRNKFMVCHLGRSLARTTPAVLTWLALEGCCFVLLLFWTAYHQRSFSSSSELFLWPSSEVLLFCGSFSVFIGSLFSFWAGFLTCFIFFIWAVGFEVQYQFNISCYWSCKVLWKIYRNLVFICIDIYTIYCYWLFKLLCSQNELSDGSMWRALWAHINLLHRL